MTSCRDAAIYLAEQHGFAIFTLPPRSKEPFAGSHGHKDASNDRDEITAMFAEHPDANIGTACGAASGNKGVIDLDLASDGSFDGRDELAEWESEHGKFPVTACAVTGRGGAHYYFHFPNGTPRKFENEDAHVDFRGEGAYAVLPPSIHANGSEYFWDLSPDDVGIADRELVVGQYLAEGIELAQTACDELRRL